MQHALHEKVSLWYLALNFLIPGVWALLHPQGFYQNFLLPGHTWVAADGPYNEHLLRDFGGLQLGLAVLVLFCLFRPQEVGVRVTSVVLLCFGVPHLIYHIGHVEAFGQPLDMVAAILLLALQVMVPLLLLVHAQPSNKS